MEYVKHGDLKGYMDSGLTEDDTKQIATQILEALEIMHGYGFTHRDIKPQNIFVIEKGPSWWIKIGDFGITKRVSRDISSLKTEIGTQEYMAPEVLRCIECSADGFQYDSSVDLWALGCLLYRILVQKPPFANLIELESYCKSPDGLLAKCLDQARVSPATNTFVCSMLAVEPKNRPDATTALQSLWPAASSHQLIPSPKDTVKDEVMISSEGTLEEELRCVNPEDCTADRRLAIRELTLLFGTLRAQDVLPMLVTKVSAVFIRHILDREFCVTAADVDPTHVHDFSHKDIQSLLDTIPSIETLDSHGDSPLHVAIENGRSDIVQLLLERGASVENVRENPSYTERKGLTGPDLRLTPLALAATENNTQSIELLLKYGAEINSSRSRESYTALHYAANFGNITAVAMLLASGADPNFAIPRGRTPLLLAVERGCEATVKWLLENYANPSTPCVIVQDHGNFEISPIHVASKIGHQQIAKLLLDRGADIEISCISYRLSPRYEFTGWRPLHFAARYGNSAAVKLLIDCGADTQSQTMRKNSALHLLCFRTEWNADCSAILRLLLTAGVDIETSNCTGNRPLHTAASCDHQEAVETLLRYGADINATVGISSDPREASQMGDMTAYAIAKSQKATNTLMVLEKVAKERRLQMCWMPKNQEGIWTWLAIPEGDMMWYLPRMKN